MSRQHGAIDFCPGFAQLRTQMELDTDATEQVMHDISSTDTHVEDQETPRHRLAQVTDRRMLGRQASPNEGSSMFPRLSASRNTTPYTIATGHNPPGAPAASAIAISPVVFLRGRCTVYLAGPCLELWSSCYRARSVICRRLVTLQIPCISTLFDSPKLFLPTNPPSKTPVHLRVIAAPCRRPL
jgi:hypothetical protein